MRLQIFILVIGISSYDPRVEELRRPWLGQLYDRIGQALAAREPNSNEDVKKQAESPHHVLSSSS